MGGITGGSVYKTHRGGGSSPPYLDESYNKSCMSLISKPTIHHHSP
jgi:hypothetical protein